MPNTLLEETMIVTANEVKRRGFSYIAKLLEKFDSVLVSFRGKQKFVVLPLEEYERLKELELEAAIREAEKDIEDGKFVVESAEEHFKRLGI
jgi:prevent-host-death family protein